MGNDGGLLGLCGTVSRVLRTLGLKHVFCHLAQPLTQAVSIVFQQFKCIVEAFGRAYDQLVELFLEQDAFF
jgi:hypothetical protein